MASQLTSLTAWNRTWHLKGSRKAGNWEQVGPPKGYNALAHIEWICNQIHQIQIIALYYIFIFYIINPSEKNLSIYNTFYKNLSACVCAGCIWNNSLNSEIHWTQWNQFNRFIVRRVGNMSSESKRGYRGFTLCAGSKCLITRYSCNFISGRQICYFNSFQEHVKSSVYSYFQMLSMSACCIKF